MQKRQTKTLGIVILAGVLFTGSLGCPSNSTFANLTAELTGNINLLFVNNTSARVIFSMGTWNPLNRGFPFQAEFDQPQIEPASSSSLTLPCDRLFAVGTQDLRDWIYQTFITDEDDFQDERLTPEIQFRLVDDDLSADSAPLLGTTAGFIMYVGNEFSCSDQIVMSFSEDPSQPGGYRVDVQVIRTPDEELDEL